MVNSMTGYGRGTAESGNVKVSVEMKSVNHRFREFAVRMPRQLLVLEDKIKKRLSREIQRGRVELFISAEGEGLAERTLQVDWDLAAQLIGSAREMREKFSLPDDISLRDILQLDSVFAIKEEEQAVPETEPVLYDAFQTALANLMKMRKEEGEELRKDLSSHIARLKAVIPAVRALAPAAAEVYRNRLAQKMLEWSDGSLDEGRLMAEAAVFADKCDISEELARLESHLLQFESSLDSTEPLGRKLDFLVQEMNREVNTVGSKANDSRITKEVVEMKSLLEKLKEQVQNIE